MSANGFTTRRKWLLSCVAVAGLAATAAITPVVQHGRGALTLLRIANAKHPPALAQVGTHPVQTVSAEVQMSSGPVPARLYLPVGVEHAPGLVIVHGVHHLGIEEPRLVAFARAIASSGIVVMTPLVASLADYSVDPAAIGLIGESARQLAQRLGAERVGVMGLSFAGGLALIAAADPRYSPSFGYVVAVGAHHDLARVMRFFASNEAIYPDGTRQHLEAHEYGRLVVMYSHPDAFFSRDDIGPARETLRLFLWEKLPESQAAAGRLTREGQVKMAIIFAHQQASFSAEILRRLPQYEAAMGEVSPRGHLAQLHVPVLLLHGAGDDVIPPSETLWLAREIPRPWLVDALISPAISHVEMGPQAGWRDQFALVHWITELLRQADRSPLSTRDPQTK